jgi:hypothetical protein
MYTESQIYTKEIIYGWTSKIIKDKEGLLEIIIMNFYIALFQAESLLKALYIITPSHRPVHSSTFSTPRGAYSRAAVRDQRYRLHKHNDITTS